MYPSNNNYCCHCPNIVLKCNFSKNPLTAFWTVLSNGVPDQVNDNTPGHTVDRSEVQNGILSLHVNHTMYSENNTYSCTALYDDGTDLDAEESAHFVLPRVES